jgi:hypothetical protein
MVRDNWRHLSAKEKSHYVLLTAKLDDTIMAAQAVEDDAKLLFSRILLVGGPTDIASELL